MSYSIMFDRQFLISDSGYIPLALMGSNNLSEPTWSGGRQHWRTVRSWQPVFGLIGVSQEYLLEYANQLVTENCELWKSKGKWVTGKSLARWMKNGIRDAMTMEELREQNPRINLHCFTSTLEEASHADPTLNRVIHSTSELNDWISSAQQSKRASDRQFYLNMEFNQEDLKVCKQHYFTGPARVQYKQYQLAKQLDGGYTYRTGVGDSFPNYHDAMTIATTIGITPFKIVPAAAAYYVIREDGARADNGMYFVRSTKQSIFNTSSIDFAKRYSSFRVADRQAMNLMAKNQHEDSIKSVVLISDSKDP